MSAVSEEEFKLKLNAYIQESKSNTFTLTPEKYNELLSDIKVSLSKRRQGELLTSLDYRRIKRYDILTIGDVEKLIKKRTSSEDEIKYFCHIDELYEIIHKAHIDTGHKRTRCMDKELKKSTVILLVI